MLTLLWFVAVLLGALALAYVNASRASSGASRIAVALAVAWVAHALPPWLDARVRRAVRAARDSAQRAGAAAQARSATPCSRRSARCCRRCRRPSARRSRPAPSGGTASSSPAGRTGRSCSTRRAPTLTADEQRFLDHDVEELCAMVTDWETTNVYRDLPPHVWQFIKDKGFLGHDHREGVRRPGLLRLRAFAGDDQAVDALAARSSVTVMVPNSLGPGELLAHYGTDEQKRHYLPRLAKGLEIPCFALTNPDCGLRCGVDSRLRHRLLGRARGQARARPARHVGQALHHAGAGRDAARPRVPRLRPRPSRRRQGGHRHHLRADSDVASGRRDRPPAHAAQRGVPERPELGQGRLHPDGLDHRRPADAGPRLADADGMPRRGPRHLAAVVGHRHGEARGARASAATRACARSSRRRSASSKASRKRSRAWAATST